MNQEERQEYVREVVHALVGLEPEDYRMSVAEFGVLQGWMDKEVPLRVVLQVIDEQSQRQETLNLSGLAAYKNPILYLKPAVEEEIRRRERTLT